MRYRIPNILMAFGILFFLPGCKDKAATASEKESASIPEKVLSVPVPYAGDWIREDYLDHVRRTGSPRKAQENIEECFIRIPASTQEYTTMIYNFHEAGGPMMAVQEDGLFHLREKTEDGLPPITLTIESLAPDKIRLGQKNFVRIHPVTENQETRILEEILFKGTYTAKTGARVEFKNNGEVIGLDGYRYYQPVIDYFDAGLQVDQVGLGMSREDLTYFGFKFDNDRLVLYKLKCLTYDQTEKRCVEVDFEDKIHELRRE